MVIRNRERDRRIRDFTIRNEQKDMGKHHTGSSELRLTRDRAHPGYLKLPLLRAPQKLLTTSLLSPRSLGALNITNTWLRKCGTRLSSPVAHQKGIYHPLPIPLIF